MKNGMKGSNKSGGTHIDNVETIAVSEHSVRNRRERRALAKKRKKQGGGK